MVLETKQAGQEADAIFKECLGLKPIDRISGDTVWPLPNMEEIPLGHLYWATSCYSPQYEVRLGQFREADRDPASKSGHPLWSHGFISLYTNGDKAGGGFAVLYTYNHMDWNSRADISEYADVLGSKDAAHPCVRAFKWSSCKHEWRETGPLERRSRGWHVYTCAKCGKTHSVDSGD